MEFKVIQSMYKGEFLNIVVLIMNRYRKQQTFLTYNVGSKLIEMWIRDQKSNNKNKTIYAKIIKLACNSEN
jgi:hypothetical protein